jgi:DNA topoisomerase-1
MAKKLVIVESPAKAKTIGGILGSDYEVQASIGHIRDLVPNARALPEEHRKKWWSDFGVDVDNDFQPFYEVPGEKSAQVQKLRQALKNKDTLVLATDEDREGEAISWHLLEVLRPPKGVAVKRIAFHELTREAVQRAIQNPRDVDRNLVEAQETRRILDRLYGYSLSPILWSRVEKNLSAGRVQSPAVKLIVEREIERRNFHSAEYWDLEATFEAQKVSFSAGLRTVNGLRVANGSDFDDATGKLDTKREVIWIGQDASAALAAAARNAEPYQVSRIEANEVQEKPQPPFMTTTLQQDANRKYGFSADRTMRIAQTLYEGVDIGGEQVGLITYMRTDSLTLSNEALGKIRDLIRAEYSDCLPEKPNNYVSKVRNAQEAHEAIRPTDPARKPAAVARYLSEEQNKLYTLIWQRSIACQMRPARVLRTEAEIAVEVGIGLSPEPETRRARVTNERGRLGFIATGRQILFDGFLRVYSEGKEESQTEKSERMLPRLESGQTVALVELDSAQHATKPPARFTDATLIKKLEDQGIGRPSTYASIISTILDRGYVRKEGRQLVPTFKAFLAYDVLEGAFQELMDLGFTAKMDETLDEISEGKADSKDYLRTFFLGDQGQTGLRSMVEERKREIPYPAYLVGEHPETGKPILVRNGKDGSPFLQHGDSESKQYANIPEDLAPADLTLERAVELLSKRAAPAESVGTDPRSGRRLLLKFRQGYYLEVERTPEEIEAKAKPTWVSVPPGVDPRTLSQSELDYLCQLPRVVGRHPEFNAPVTFKMGKFGAYVECGEERRTVDDWRVGETLTIEDAVTLLSQPKFAAKRTSMSVLKEFGPLEGAEGPVKVMSGRYGPYVTDGTTNATLPKGVEPASLDEAEAIRLLAARREAGPAKKPSRRRTTAKSAATKKAPATKKAATGKKAAPKRKAP